MIDQLEEVSSTKTIHPRVAKPWDRLSSSMLNHGTYERISFKFCRFSLML